MNKNLNVKWTRESAIISSSSKFSCKIGLLYNEGLWLAEKINEHQVIDSSKFQTLADAYIWAENILLLKTD